MKYKAFLIVFEELSFGEKKKIIKIADTSFKYCYLAIIRLCRINYFIYFFAFRIVLTNKKMSIRNNIVVNVREHTFTRTFEPL